MAHREEPFTLGRWTVKEGKQTEFISHWQRFATQTAKDMQPGGSAYLLQDETNPRQFISFGAWDNPSKIQAWRQSPEFSNFMTNIKPICEQIEPHTMRLVAVADGVERK